MDADNSTQMYAHVSKKEARRGLFENHPRARGDE
jgi:hypothetical protein